MASFLYNQGLGDMLDGTVDIDTDTLKIMLCTTSYTANKDHEVVDNGANDATDPSFNELTVTGYTGGFAGAGRRTKAITLVVNDTDDRVDIGIDSDETWTSLAAGETIGWCLLIDERTNDTDSRLLCAWDVTDTPTNGGDVTLDFTVAASGGNIQFST